MVQGSWGTNCNNNFEIEYKKYTKNKFLLVNDIKIIKHNFNSLFFTLIISRYINYSFSSRSLPEIILTILPESISIIL